ncbi:hypothetical protein BU14_1989s0001 [Porphyra umbilicalis]|uniref:Uncharacterized protein n=1 Tax=Porphyra umbilicalis TaxID=2786 RepID=A0A1X6NK70_PORUM|nr:hypothetical protein BU14_1989s0001 [Porphyra umbilicalis]|eukprot:OSX68995.1 hypothetical protein BU14_1989s0001 [Porphyra umbilicalis]
MGGGENPALPTEGWRPARAHRRRATRTACRRHRGRGRQSMSKPLKEDTYTHRHHAQQHRQKVKMETEQRTNPSARQRRCPRQPVVVGDAGGKGVAVGRPGGATPPPTAPAWDVQRVVPHRQAAVKVRVVPPQLRADLLVDFVKAAATALPRRSSQRPTQGRRGAGRRAHRRGGNTDQPSRCRAQTAARRGERPRQTGPPREGCGGPRRCQRSSTVRGPPAAGTTLPRLFARRLDTPTPLTSTARRRAACHRRHRRDRRLHSGRRKYRGRPPQQERRQGPRQHRKAGSPCIQCTDRGRRGRPPQGQHPRMARRGRLADPAGRQPVRLCPGCPLGEGSHHRGRQSTRRASVSAHPRACPRHHRRRPWRRRRGRRSHRHGRESRRHSPAATSPPALARPSRCPHRIRCPTAPPWWRRPPPRPPCPCPTRTTRVHRPSRASPTPDSCGCYPRSCSSCSCIHATATRRQTPDCPAPPAGWSAATVRRGPPLKTGRGPSRSPLSSWGGGAGRAVLPTRPAARPPSAAGR